MMCHARSAWWLETKSYARRKPRHRLASLGNPKKKKCSLLFLFSRGWIFSEKGKDIFLFGFCPPSIRTVWWGFNADSVLRNPFSQKIVFAKPRLLCYCILSARRRGLGNAPKESKAPYGVKMRAGF